MEGMKEDWRVGEGESEWGLQYLKWNPKIMRNSLSTNFTNLFDQSQALRVYKYVYI